MKVIFIADFFANEVPGGGELNNKVLCELLRSRNHEVLEIKSGEVTESFIQKNKNSHFIISNFMLLAESCKQKLLGLKYIIYEHDHKYLKNRNPAAFPNYKAPISEITNVSFYKNAVAVLCQSNLHCEILLSNLSLENVKNLGGNIWSDEILDKISELSKNSKKDQFSVMQSPIQHKNTSGAISYCVAKESEFELISGPYLTFLGLMSRNKKIVFLPQTPETLSRVVVEARMLGVEVHVNSKVGATTESWFKLKGDDLISFMREKKNKIVESIEGLFKDGVVHYHTPSKESPKISLITSLFKGDEFIEGFLENITEQTAFGDCELIIIDGASPGNERNTIEKFQERYDNIRYERLDEDPGIYACWNRGLELATGQYISNANLDDKRSKQQLEIFSRILEESDDVDLVYSECLVTQRPGEQFTKNSSQGQIYPVAPFSRESMIKCLPGCMPLWKRSLHDTSGVFEESYKFAGDWEMWLRAVRAGASFKKVKFPLGLYYVNPEGLSTTQEEAKVIERYVEEKGIFWEYIDVFGYDVVSQYANYFSQGVDQ